MSRSLARDCLRPSHVKNGTTISSAAMGMLSGAETIVQSCRQSWTFMAHTTTTTASAMSSINPRLSLNRLRPSNLATFSISEPLRCVIVYPLNSALLFYSSTGRMRAQHSTLRHSSLLDRLHLRFEHDGRGARD